MESMNKVGQLLKKHDLKKELVDNKEFIDNVKKLFEEHELECNEEQIKEIIDNVCYRLERSGELSEKDLIDIAGGAETEESEEALYYGKPQPEINVDEKKKHSTVAKIADVVIKATTTIIGCAVGGAVGAALSSEIKFENRKVKDVTIKAFPTAIGVGTGSVLGYKLGRSISNQLGLS